MRESIKRILKEYIFTESLDKPFSNVIEKEFTKYFLNEDNVKVNFSFKLEYDLRLLPPHLIDINKLKFYYEIYWSWDKDMENQYKTSYNWKRVSATSFKILDMFIRKYNPELIMFKGRHPKMSIIYNYDQFLDVLKNLFYFNYFVKNYDDKIYIIRKDISNIHKDNIKKMVESDDCGETYESAVNQWSYPNRCKKDMKGIYRNRYIKDQKRRIYLKEFFLN